MTTAPGTAASLASVTVPEIEDVDVCPLAENTSKAIRANPLSPWTDRCIIRERRAGNVRAGNITVTSSVHARRSLPFARLRPGFDESGQIGVGILPLFQIVLVGS